MQLQKKDIIIAAGIGLFVAAVLLVVAQNVALNIPYFNYILIAFPVLSVLGIWVSWLLSKKRPFFFELGKFGLIGGLNTAVDLGVLNILIIVTGIASGYPYSVFKGVSFLAAVVNSYAWNKK